MQADAAHRAAAGRGLVPLPAEETRTTPRADGISPGSSILRYEVEAETKGPGVSTAITREAELFFDSSAGVGRSLFGPTDLLAAAFAACILKNVERFSRMLPLRYRRAQVNVVSERGDAPPGSCGPPAAFDIETDEPPHRVDLPNRNIAKSEPSTTRWPERARSVARSSPIQQLNGAGHPLPTPHPMGLICFNLC